MNGVRRCLPVLLLAAAPAASSASPAQPIVTISSGGCSLTVEADEQDHALRLRVAPYGCRASRESVEEVLRAAFSRTDPPRLEGPYTSLFLGRLVEYPWLAAHLVSTAAADRRWDARAGKAVGVGTYAYVAAVLSAPEATVPFEPALRAGGYRIRAATVEKVLIMDLRRASEYDGPRPPGKLPFDAMVWLRLERRSPRRRPDGGGRPRR